MTLVRRGLSVVSATTAAFARAFFPLAAYGSALYVGYLVGDQAAFLDEARTLRAAVHLALKSCFGHFDRCGDRRGHLAADRRHDHGAGRRPTPTTETNTHEHHHRRPPRSLASHPCRHAAPARGRDILPEIIEQDDDARLHYLFPAQAAVKRLRVLAAAIPIFLETAAPAVACYEQAGAYFGIDHRLLRAIAIHEAAEKLDAVGINKNGTQDLCAMQVNSSWLPRLSKFGLTRDALLSDTCSCVYAGSWVLANCVKEFGYNWHAVACYHTRDSERGQQYAESVLRKAHSLASQSK